jgi:hypothetical protein
MNNDDDPIQRDTIPLERQLASNMASTGKRKAGESEKKKSDRKRIKARKEFGDKPKGPTVVTPGFNLAGRPAQIKDSALKKTLRRHVAPSNPGWATDHYWLFHVKTNRSEWVRFFPDSLTLTLWGNYDNPTRLVAGTAEQRAEKHSLRAKSGFPFMFMDPSVMGSGFVKDVSVTINGVQVPTNSYNSHHLLHYVRLCSIFNNKPRPYFATSADIARPTTRLAATPTMSQACLPFDYETYNSTRGSRIPVYLDGKFPFDFKNRTLETLDGVSEPTLYFPPDSDIVFRVELYKDRIESIFHDGVANLAGYIGADNVQKPTGNLALSFQDVKMEFEIAQLNEKEHLRALEQFTKGAYATYNYDVPRAQYQAILSGQSYVENNFQIPPHCRLIYISFLPSHAAFVMETTNKPLSNWSQFPEHQSGMRLSFAGEQDLICELMERFGDYDESDQLSKKTYYDYLKERKIFRGKFEDLFPRPGGVNSIVQTVVLDVKPYYSEKTELLSIKQHFTSGAHRSPDHRQILVLSVHTDGRAVCKYGGAAQSWVWHFDE